MDTKAAADMLMNRASLQAPVTGYTAGHDPAPALISPSTPTCPACPPDHPGRHPRVPDDAIRLTRQAATADAEVTLGITPAVPHLFQTFHPLLDQAAAALDQAGQFLTTHLTSTERISA